MGLNDEEDFEPITAAQRRAAELAMKRRDKQQRKGRRGARAARRTLAPDLLQSDESEEEMAGGLLAGMKRRARRQYDERLDVDDADGIESVSPCLYLMMVNC